MSATESWYDTVHGITTVDAQYIKPGVASIQLVVQDGHAASIDTGTTLSLPFVQEALAAKGIDPTYVDYVIPTHVHLDHAGGAGAMMEAFPNATLIIHPQGKRHMVDPGRLWQGTLEVYGEKAASRLYGKVVPVDEQRIVVADDDFELDFRGRHLRFLDTPGHARHHFCVVDTANHVIFAGDTMGVSFRALDGPNGPFVFPTSSPVQFEPDKLHVSIDRLMETDPQHIFVTHFGRIDASKRIAEALHRLIDGYVAISNSLDDPADIELLRHRIAEYMLDEARAHGVPLPDDEIRPWLKMDAKLNADGLAIWMARQRKKQQQKTAAL
jgi:glyoxylase-like metal-dependent hydrolase (beta-lactamase superfamily II)